MSDSVEATPQRRGGMNFRRANYTKLDPALAKRQGDISRLAFQHLGRDRAIAFLNADDAALGGRPLELAMASDTGFAQVEARIGELGTTSAETGEQG